jgi:hypothetical protein
MAAEDKSQRFDRVQAGLLTGLFVLGHYMLFSPFFPNRFGNLGHDYAYFLPHLLDTTIWFKSNGLFQLPWFTPSFCGGWVNFPNPQSLAYSVPSLLGLLMDPLAAVRMTFFLFAWVGAVGAYLLIHRVFAASMWSALLGGAIFLFNGYYIHRMLVGHLGHCAFMLVPLIGYMLLVEDQERLRGRHIRPLMRLMLAGMLLAYQVYAGYGPMMAASLMSVVGIGLLRLCIGGRWTTFAGRFLGAGALALMLCASKLTAIFYLMANFSRSGYRLPGAENLLQATGLVFRSLFISPSVDSDRFSALVNVQWGLQRHEWEYSVTLLPLVVIAGAFISLIFKQGLRERGPIIRLRYAAAVMLALLLSIPILVNTFHPGWNAFLKTIPVIKGASSLIRWFSIYIPVVTVLTAVSLDFLFQRGRQRKIAALMGTVTILAASALVDRSYYQEQKYDPGPVVAAYNRLETAKWTPRINAIGVYRTKDGTPAKPLNNNDMMIHNASPLYCYEPLFGYRLEYFPRGHLRQGSVFAETGEDLNVKNPVCYIWPESNDCPPGTHFDRDHLQAADRFVGYGPFDFYQPLLQRISNWVNGMTLMATGLFISGGLLVAVLRKLTSHKIVGRLETPPR